jgi:uncharacterized protein (TIGR03435 family)
MRLATIAAGILACLSIGALAQTLETFEVASVRPSGPRSADSPDEAAPDAPTGQMGGPGTSDPTRIFYSRVPLQRLVMNAYGVQADQISGPVWLESERFDITANVRRGATQAQVDGMLQNLLIERFKLALHHTTKDGPVYELTVAKGGAKLKESSLKESSGGAAPGGRGRVEMARNNGIQRETCHACSIADLIRGVQGFDPQRLAPERIVDKTGLTGSYEFTLEFAAPLAGGKPMKLSAIQSQAHAGQDVFAALERQLGLKLEKGRGPVDMLVIEHVEKTPTEN